MHSNQNLDGSDNCVNNEYEDDMYEDDSNQEEPAILQSRSPHETEEVDDQNGANDPTTHSRLQRQQPSRQGRVAYVIYGGRGSEPGVYYNWASCIAVIRRYYQNSAPPYLGFNAEEHARTSFAAFQASGELPAGLFPPTSLRSVDGTPVPSSQSPPPLTPPRRGMTPASPFRVSRIPVNPPLQSTPRSPIRAPQGQSAFTPQTPVYPALHMKANLGSTSNSTRRDPLSPVPTPLSSIRASTSVVIPMFYLVIEGEAPGVYGSQIAALHARGLHGSRVTIYTTRETANQAFVDAYMASRVSALPAPGR